MRIQNLAGASWRCWSEFQIEDAGQWNLFEGPNGSGKTSILEAIWAMTRLRTARGHSLRRACKIGGTYTPAIKACIAEDLPDASTTELRLEIPGNQSPRTWIDSEPATAAMFSRHVPSVLFLPSDTKILLESGDIRREILQRVSFVSAHEFLDDFKRFSSLLGQRNELLKRRKYHSGSIRTSEIQIWDEMYVQQAAIVEKSMRTSFYILSALVTPILQEMFGDSSVHLRLKSSVEEEEIPYQEDVGNRANESTKEIGLKTASFLQKAFEKDLRNGYTSIGPHRLDWQLYFQGVKAREIASQGQIRSSVIAIRMATALAFRDAGQRAPVLLVDDIAGELDTIRTEYLFGWAAETGFQTWVTGTDLKQVREGKLVQDMRNWKTGSETLIVQE